MSIRASSLGLWMAVITAIAVGLGAFRAGTVLAANIACNLTALILLAAAVKARYTRGAAGAWWFGFALVGWTQWILSLAAEILGETVTPAKLIADVMIRSLYLLDPLIEGAPLKLIQWPVYSRKLILECILSLALAPAGAWIVRLYFFWSKPAEET